MLPENYAEFPPPTIRECRPKWLEWYSLLDGRTVIGGGLKYEARHSAQMNGGLSGLAARALWGAPKAVACDNGAPFEIGASAGYKVAMAAAEVVFSTLPAVKIRGDMATQLLVDDLQDGFFWDLMAQAEVVSSTFGGVYLTTQWGPYNTMIRPRVVRSDIVEPTFSFGSLTSVAFYYDLDEIEGSSVKSYRLVESHELLEDGRGVVLFALYAGEPDGMGRRIPLNDHPAAAAKVEIIDPELGDGYFTGLVDKLDVVYIRNPKPSLSWRGEQARNLGSSDFVGSETAMRELAYWKNLRAEEARLNKTRLHIPASFGNAEVGKGIVQNIDQSVYTVIPDSRGGALNTDGHDRVQQTQGVLRNDQFQLAIEDSWRAIASLTGFSLLSLGVVKDASANRTATGVKVQKDSTQRTAFMKQNVWRSALRSLFEIMVAQQAAVYGGVYSLESVEIQFSAADTVDALELANTVSMLMGAGAMSRAEAIRTLHPDWDESQVATELAEIARQSVAEAAIGSTEQTTPTVNDIVSDMVSGETVETDDIASEGEVV